MNTKNAWAVVAQREISIRLRDKTFIGSTLLSLVILIGVFGFQTWQSNKDTTFDVAVTSQSQQMGQVLHTAGTKGGNVGVDLVDVADDDAAEAALNDGEADAWLERTDDGWKLIGKDSVDDQLKGFAGETISRRVMADNAQQAGTSIGKLQQGATVSTASLNGDADQEAAGQVVGFIMAILFYMSALMFGSYLAMSVTEEKQSRIVEIIATSIPLRQLLIGKLVGMVVLAVGQMMLYALIGIIGVSFTDMGDLLPGLTSSLVWFVLYFLAGFTMIAAMFAVSGALASRQEDIQSTSMPVTMLIMVVFFAAVFAKGTVAEVLAWIPPFSAIIQPMRLAAGDGTWWEALLGLGILAATTAVVIVLAERIYRRALLQTSGKLRVKEAWNAEV